MPRWTQEQLHEYEARRLSRSAKPEQLVFNEPVAKAQGKESNATRIHVCITSFRRRLIDPDNLCAKFFIDCCKYAGLITDDSAEHITVETRQEKVEFKFDERTEIELT